MESAFQWINDLARWFARLVPRWKVITESQGGVAFVRGWARIIKPGIFWWWPAWTEIHVQEVVRQTLNLPPQSMMTRDRKDMAVSGIVVYEIADPLTAFVKVHDLDAAIQDMALASIKSVLWGRTLNEIYDHAGELDQLLCAECRAKLSGWGVKIHSIFLSDLSNAMVVRHLGSRDGDLVIGPTETPERQHAAAE
ncbi:MAG: SPFH domain-containing protein [Planctomycetota bacterium]|jgi:regulator of protease activity HflC (stomatin/prohibitin superfamily)